MDYIFDKKDIYTHANCKEALEKYKGEWGYFAHDIAAYDDKLYWCFSVYGMLTKVDPDDETFCLYAYERGGFKCFLPSDKVKIVY